MIIINDILYLSFTELQRCGTSNKIIWEAKYRNYKGWHFITDPADARKRLIEYEPLPPKYKDRILDTYGDPYQYYSDHLITNLLKVNHKDEELILKAKLEREKKKQYIHACRYLHLLSTLTKKEINALGYKSIKSDFYPALIRILKHDTKLPKQFPKSYVKLTQKVKQYKIEGAAAVIPKSINNNNATKINSVQQAFIQELISKHNQFDYEQIKLLFNKVAEQHNWKQISVGTVRNQFKSLELLSSRKGFQNWRNKNDFVISRERPSRPGYLWEGDGTPYELLYQAKVVNTKGHSVTKYWKRKVIYVVSDAFNDTIVGLSIHDTENVAMTKMAWKNAIYMTDMLPFQIKTDNFAKKELAPFFESIAKTPDYFTPAAVGNARDKRIEALFGRIIKFVTKVHPNHSGHNITAKNQPNREYLDKIKKTFPDEDEVLNQILFDIYAWNNMPRKKLGGKSLYQQWSEGFEKAKNDNEARVPSDLRKLELFGETYNRTPQLTNKGIQFHGQQYMNFDTDFYSNIGSKFTIQYNPDNTNLILATTLDGKQNWLLDKVENQAGCLKDSKPGDRIKLNKKLEFKAEVKEKFLLKTAENRKKLIQEAELEGYLESEIMAKLMFTVEGQQKTLNYKAQEALQSNTKQEEDVYDLEHEPIEFSNLNDNLNPTSL